MANERAPMTPAEIEATILTAVRDLAARKLPGLVAVTGEQRLIADLRLDSMDIAELVALLEVELDADPFAESASIADVHTVADLVAIYARPLT